MRMHVPPIARDTRQSSHCTVTKTTAFVDPPRMPRLRPWQVYDGAWRVNKMGLNVLCEDRPKYYPCLTPDGVDFGSARTKVQVNGPLAHPAVRSPLQDWKHEVQFLGLSHVVVRAEDIGAKGQYNDLKVANPTTRLLALHPVSCARVFFSVPKHGLCSETKTLGQRTRVCCRWATCTC